VADGVKPWRTVLRSPRKRVMGQLIRGFKSHLHRSFFCEFVGAQVGLGDEQEAPELPAKAE